MEHRYSIGLDFGTLSARATLVDVETGQEKASLVCAYQNGVIDEVLPGAGIKVPKNSAFQDPQDYLDTLENLLSGIRKKANVEVEQIIGIGINFTACTVVALDQTMMPMCFNSQYREDMHSWVKLWKHHGAQDEADVINMVANSRNEAFIQRYGCKSSSEWMFAKIFETLNQSPKLFNDTFCFMEAGDWLVYQLTGEVKKSSVFAGYKAFWDENAGYPSPEYFKAVHPKLEHVVREKIRFEDAIFPPGVCVGGLTKLMAHKTQLKEGTRVSVASIDAHVGVPATGIKEENTILMVMGTSLCHMLISKEEVPIEGISGVVKNGILPGFYGYEAGQAAVGDIYEWFVGNMVSCDYTKEALQKGINIYDLVDEKADKLQAGRSGILALDWWNGNRSILANSDLSGVLIGMTLTTKPEEIYRAIVEATAFGSRLIIERFESKGIVIRQIYACGGLAEKSPFIMQIFSDILGLEINVTESQQTSSLGAAMLGAVAAGEENGGYRDLFAAMEKMSSPIKRTYRPRLENKLVYDRLYVQYQRLHDFFGARDKDSTMWELKALRDNCS